jgi:hypothetical protein
VRPAACHKEGRATASFGPPPQCTIKRPKKLLLDVTCSRSQILCNFRLPHSILMQLTHSLHLSFCQWRRPDRLLFCDTQFTWLLEKTSANAEQKVTAASACRVARWHRQIDSHPNRHKHKAPTRPARTVEALSWRLSRFTTARHTSGPTGDDDVALHSASGGPANRGQKK